MPKTTTTGAIRLFEAHGIKDAAARIRAMRLATRARPKDLRAWPENPPGKSDDLVAKRHVVSLLLSLAAPSPAEAWGAIEAMECLPLRMSTSPDVGAPFMPLGQPTMARDYLESLVESLALLSPVELDEAVSRMVAADWLMGLMLEGRRVTISWRRLEGGKSRLSEIPAFATEADFIAAMEENLAKLSAATAALMESWKHPPRQSSAQDFERAGSSFVSFERDPGGDTLFVSSARRIMWIDFPLIGAVARMWRDTRHEEKARTSGVPKSRRRISRSPKNPISTPEDAKAGGVEDTAAFETTKPKYESGASPGREAPQSDRVSEERAVASVRRGSREPQQFPAYTARVCGDNVSFGWCPTHRQQKGLKDDRASHHHATE